MIKIKPVKMAKPVAAVKPIKKSVPMKKAAAEKNTDALEAPHRLAGKAHQFRYK
jgi:hypothetical protein